VLLIVAAAGRLGKSNIRWSGGIVVLGIVQAILGMASESVPAIGPLHTLNALAIFAATGLLAHRAWARDSSPATPAAAQAV
jgi:heme A synthase